MPSVQLECGENWGCMEKTSDVAELRHCKEHPHTDTGVCGMEMK